MSPDVQGGRLGVRLLRSVLTLGAIHLLRFGFAIGAAQVASDASNASDAHFAAAFVAHILVLTVKFLAPSEVSLATPNPNTAIHVHQDVHMGCCGA